MSGAAIFAGISIIPNRQLTMSMAASPSTAPRAAAMPAARRGESLYEVLRVSSTATAGEIKAAYRSMAKRLHPDVAPEGAEDFLELRQAYGTLSNASARAQYDLLIGRCRGKFPGAFSRRSRRRWETDQCW